MMKFHQTPEKTFNTFICSTKAEHITSNFSFACWFRTFGNFQSIPKNLSIKKFRFPPIILDFLWNRLHVLPIEWLIGDVDIFITSDWTEPPSKAKKATILYDLIVYKYPLETDSKIVETQKNKLRWVKRESDIIFCISESTKKDAMEILNIPENRLRVIYPGII